MARPDCPTCKGAGTVTDLAGLPPGFSLRCFCAYPSPRMTPELARQLKGAGKALPGPAPKPAPLEFELSPEVLDRLTKFPNAGRVLEDSFRAVLMINHLLDEGVDERTALAAVRPLIEGIRSGP